MHRTCQETYGSSTSPSNILRIVGCSSGLALLDKTVPSTYGDAIGCVDQCRPGETRAEGQDRKIKLCPSARRQHIFVAHKQHFEADKNGELKANILEAHNTYRYMPAGSSPPHERQNIDSELLKTFSTMCWRVSFDAKRLPL